MSPKTFAKCARAALLSSVRAPNVLLIITKQMCTYVEMVTNERSNDGHGMAKPGSRAGGPRVDGDKTTMKNNDGDMGRVVPQP